MALFRPSEYLIARFITWSPLLSSLSFIIGLVWFLLLAHPYFNNETYISEHALLPGLVNTELGGSARNIHKFLHDLQGAEFTSGRDGERDIPCTHYLSLLQSIGADVFAQRFEADIYVANATLRGTNCYGIIRAPRAASTESIVIFTSYKLHPKNISSAPAVSLMLQLARYFVGKPYLSKDLIFLVAEHDRVGVQAWLNTYHHTPNPYLTTRGLAIPGLTTSGKFGRAGAIQAAINLEMLRTTYHYIDIKMEGLNGQMPNLDLVNTVIRIARMEGIRCGIQGVIPHKSPQTWKGYLSSLRTLSLTSLQQAGCHGSSSHALFLPHGVDSLTISTVTRSTSSSRQTADYATLAPVLEGIIRSVNNLLEHFHQSFFFYLLSSPNRYISIGVYMPPLALILLPPVIQGLALYLHLTTPPITASKLPLPHSNHISPPSSTISPLIPLCLTAHLLGLLLYLSPSVLTHLGSSFKLSPDNALLTGSLAIFLGSVGIFPQLMASVKPTQKTDGIKTSSAQTDPIVTNSTLLNSNSKEIEESEPPQPDIFETHLRVVKCFSLFQFSLITYSLSLFNPSLSLLVGLVGVPAHTLVWREREGSGIPLTLLHKFSFLLTLLASPLAMACLATYLTNYLTSSPSFTTSLSTNLLLTAVDSYLHSNWLYTITCHLLFPNWLLFYYIQTKPWFS